MFAAPLQRRGDGAAGTARSASEQGAANRERQGLPRAKERDTELQGMCQGRQGAGIREIQGLPRAAASDMKLQRMCQRRQGALSARGDQERQEAR